MSSSMTSGAKPKSSVAKAKEKIFFEKQEGSLCGQHCLNNALQGKVFSAVDLSDIAKQLDEQERQTMAERGTDTVEYKEFMNKPSANFDDSGYFSIQVLSQAFKNLGLELLSLNSDDARCVRARENPTDERLFICHMNDHWFSLRRFGTQWINLNSFLPGPELISDMYQLLLLDTLKKDGYTIFVVFGELPENEADRAWSCLQKGPDGKYLDDYEESGHRLGSADCGTEEEQLQRGIQLSLAKTPAEVIRAQRSIFLSRLASKPTNGNL